MTVHCFVFSARDRAFKQHYDVATPRERLEERRRPFLENLDFDHDDSDIDE